MSIDAYWISPEGEQHPVTTSHFEYVKDNPNLFGLTSADIKDEYDKQEEKSKTVANAERVIIKSLLKKGWVETQFDPNINSWIIKYTVREKNINLIVYNWIQQNDILANGANFIFIHSNIKPIFVYNKEIEKYLSEENYNIEERCLNCKHSIWAVAIGQGFFCTNKNKISQGGNRAIGREFKRYLIPNRNYVCKFFEKKNCNCDIKNTL